MHVTHELLWAVIDGSLPRKVLEEIVKEHLIFLCPVCREELETFDWRKHREKVADPSVYDPHFDGVVASVRKSQRQFAKEDKQARKWLRDLRKLPAAERRGKVDRAHKHFRGSHFVELLVDECRRHLPGNPWGAYAWADTAFVAQARTSGLEQDSRAMVRVMAHRGNALRALGRLRDADADFRFARRLANEKNVTDLLVCAELDSLEGSLRKDQRRLNLAVKLLHRAVALYRIIRDDLAVARTQMTLALVYYDLAETEESIRVTRAAFNSLSPEETPELFYCARLNLARSLEDLGKIPEAEGILREDATAHREYFDHLTRCRVLWLEGRIAATRGRWEEGEEKLSVAREGLVAAGIGYDVAMFSLDLALVLLERGKIDSLKRVSREALELFGAEDVHPEAFAAFKLFCDAVLAERATAELVAETFGVIRALNAEPLPASQGNA